MGKFALAFADTFGEIRNGSAAYYLAMACDEIWLQPSGDVGLTGMLLESPFLRGTLDKVGIKPKLSQRYEYKTAATAISSAPTSPSSLSAGIWRATAWPSRSHTPASCWTSMGTRSSPRLSPKSPHGVYATSAR